MFSRNILKCQRFQLSPKVLYFIPVKYRDKPYNYTTSALKVFQNEISAENFLSDISVHEKIRTLVRHLTLISSSGPYNIHPLFKYRKKLQYCGNLIYPRTSNNSLHNTMLSSALTFYDRQHLSMKVSTNSSILSLSCQVWIVTHFG